VKARPVLPSVPAVRLQQAVVAQWLRWWDGRIRLARLDAQRVRWQLAIATHQCSKHHGWKSTDTSDEAQRR
jgi:hypothetical protein